MAWTLPSAYDISASHRRCQNIASDFRLRRPNCKHFPPNLCNWDLVNPIVADPAAQDNKKRNNIQKLIYIYIYTKAFICIDGNSLLRYTEGGDKTSQYSYLVVILSNWFPNNWIYRCRCKNRFRLHFHRRSSYPPQSANGKFWTTGQCWHASFALFPQLCP